MLLSDLPDDGLEHVACFLDAPNLLQFLSCHPRLVQLSQKASFWRTLITSATDNLPTNCDFLNCAQAAREAYLTKAYVHALPMVEWKPCRSSRLSPTGREGHLACTLGEHVVLCGGFTDDEHVYVLNTTNSEDWQKLVPTELKPWRHSQLPPVAAAAAAAMDPFWQDQHNPNVALSTVYGATLTALDNRRAIRFGGFRGGGYNGECDQLALLTLTEEGGEVTWQVIEPLHRVAPRAYHTATLVAGRYLYVFGGMAGDGCMRNEALLDTHTWTWMTETSVTCESRWPKPTKRHGHSLVMDERRNRMVLFGGGTGTDLLRSGTDNSEVWELKMGTKWRTAKTPIEFQQSLPWEWHVIMFNEDSDDENEDSESEEESEIDEDDIHHQNMVAQIDNLGDIDRHNNQADAEPARLSETREDDTDEFHSLPANQGEDNDSDFASLPPLETRNATNNNGEEVPAAAQQPAAATNAQPNNENNAARPAPVRQRILLTDAEKLILGRCHMSFKVGPDTVILAFGSGRPTTNGVMGFNLSNSRFFRLALKTNTLPTPRFTAAGTVFGRYNSYILVHGGYTTQQGFAIADMCVLDLAPALKREFICLPSQPNYEPSQPVTDNDIGRRPPFGHHFGHGMGIGGMEDLLQNMFFELAAEAGGRLRRGGGRRVDLADMLDVLVGPVVLGHGQLPGEEDEDNIDDLGGEDDEEDGDDDDIVRGLFAQQNLMQWGVDEVEEEFDDDMSEVS